MSEKENLRKVKTDPFRMSFPFLLETREDKDTGRKSYQLSMLLPPDVKTDRYRAALREAMVTKFGDDQKKWPKLARGPDDVIRDFGEYNAGTEKPLAGDWKGWTLIRANAPEDRPPSVVGPLKDASGKFPTITDKREVYAGRWARATIEAYYYPRNGHCLTFGLQNVQLLKHDDRFGAGNSRPEDDFDNAPEEWTEGEEKWADEEKATTASKKESGGW